MKKILLISLALFSLFSFVMKGYAECSIDGKQSPLLAQYEKEMKTKFSKLRQNAKNNCGPTAGWWISSMNKTIELFDRAKVQIPLYNDIVTDFQYNITMTLRGESRSAVLENGKVFARIYNSTINPAIENLTSTCNLNEWTEEFIIEAIRTNSVLESIYKNVAIGNAPSSEWLSNTYLPLYNEIITTYTPGATESCKNEQNFQEGIDKILTSFTKGTFGIENSFRDWQEWIDLFSWASKKYNDTKRRLLLQELNRQWVTKWASDIIMSNFDCVRRIENGEWSAEDKSKAVATCKEFPIVGLDKARENLEKATNQGSKTTTAYIANTLKNQSRINDEWLVASLYEQYKWEASLETKVDDKILTSLIEMHIKIVNTNELLSKRIPVMYKNCMKALPDIPCPN